MRKILLILCILMGFCGCSPSDGQSESAAENLCTLLIDCSTIFDNMNELESGKAELLPPDGVIFSGEVSFSDGETVFDLLKRVCAENRIHMEFSWTPLYGSAYIEGINNLYEFDCGSGSGWLYGVNGEFKNYGSSGCALQNGDVVEWRYTCDLGGDLKREE
ncbi:MAG: DUF4430 domain-containing protein [Lachnospiraceae bacterium]|nr:DUF4430 domain-containing protein [Ruminococcus sp.]MCM1276736.1 DUF4430 domain-containing protein [Lachnospiraceae bacterium]